METTFFDKCMLELAANYAHTTMDIGQGGPFGAAVVKDGKLITVASNSVLKDNDPTAHAEINAIRNAGKILGTYNLSGCEIYTTSEPCPMCMSAIIWANIKKVHISAMVEDAEQIGFRDRFIYKYLADFVKGEICDGRVVSLYYHDRSIGQNLFKEYSESNKTIY